MNNTIVSPADRLRVALKQAGFTARQVTVRAPHSTLHVTIRDTSVSLARVADIAGAFECVRRDHATGEILAGGNAFIVTEYAAALVDPLKAEILAVLEPAPVDEWISLPRGYRAIKVSRERGATYYDEVRIAGEGFDDRNRMAVGVGHAAKRIAVACLNASASGKGSAA
jgi:hypothetical protein